MKNNMEKKEDNKKDVDIDVKDLVPKKDAINFAGMLVGPHDKKSREVTKKDIKRVMKDAKNMYNICYTRVGIYNGFLAIAHQQITEKDPLRFFVTKDAELIVNPVITRHTSVTVDSEEGCATFPGYPPTIVQRWNKCEVDYKTIDDEGVLSNSIHEKLSSKRAKVFQHELNHMDSVYIYKLEKDKTYCGGDHCSGLWNLECDDPNHPKAEKLSN